MKNFTPSIHFIIIILISVTSFGQSTATYDITFTSIWESVADNATEGQSTINLPGNAHWSSLVGATHQTTDEFLAMGGSATPGIESVAETGSFSTFQTEVTTNPDADQFINGGGLGSGKGDITINNLQVSEDYPLITLASMIAPSPDWFIAVNSINLRSGNSVVNNGWKDTFTVDVFPYDAGTEDGSGYSGSNPATSPHGVITSRSNITPFNDKKIGTITFTYNSSILGVNDPDGMHSIRIAPNPSDGNLTISNPRNLNLQTIEVYNILGRLVKKIPSFQKASKSKINLTDLNSGIYILKINTDTGRNRAQKLIIR